MNTPRILTGLLLGAGALAALPSAASAAATCSYDAASRTASIQYGAADTSVTVTNGATLRFSEGGGFLRSCFSTAGVAATVTNTNVVKIKAPANPTATQNTIIDESNGDLSRINPALRFNVTTGSGNDRLTVRESSSAEGVRLRQMSGLGLGPAVDLDFDGDDDITMLTAFGVVEVDGGGGADFIDASKAQSYQVVLHGDAGNDSLVGGANGDNLDGGAGDDDIVAKDGKTDIVNGGTGTDKATVDSNLDRLTSLEALSF